MTTNDWIMPKHMFLLATAVVRDSSISMSSSEMAVGSSAVRSMTRSEVFGVGEGEGVEVIEDDTECGLMGLAAG